MTEVTTVTINGKIRRDQGKKANKRTRATGWLPGIIYGHKQDPVVVALPTKEFEQALRKGAHVLTINLDNVTEQVLVKEVQWDHLGSSMMHVDLARVDLSERVKITVQIILRGTPKGTLDGGVLEQVLAEMEVDCVVTQIPENFRVNVADLGIGQTLHLKDVPLPAGIVATGDPEQVVAFCRVPGEEAVPEAAAAVAEAGAVEPEIITRGKAEAEEGEEA